MTASARRLSSFSRSVLSYIAERSNNSPRLSASAAKPPCPRSRSFHTSFTAALSPQPTTPVAPSSSMAELTGDPKRHHESKFDDGLSGHCLCGSINVTIKDPDLFRNGARRGHLCHCANCRKVAGSYVASNLVIEEEKVEITDRDGTLKEFTDAQTGSGTPMGRFFCGTCGNPIKTVTPLYPGKVIIKMGMFPRIPAPEFETFGDHRHDWQGTHGNVKIYKIKAGQEVLDL